MEISGSHSIKKNKQQKGNCHDIEMFAVETNGSFQNHPKLIRHSHYMVLPQTFSYRISTMQSFKSYLIFMIFDVHTFKLEQAATLV